MPYERKTEQLREISIIALLIHIISFDFFSKCNQIKAGRQQTKLTITRSALQRYGLMKFLRKIWNCIRAFL